MKTYSYYLAAILLFLVISFGEVLSQTITIERSVIGSGGMVGVRNSGNIQMSGITGQTAIEKLTGTVPVIDGKKVDVYQGFWVPVGDYLIDVEDNEPVSLNTELTNYPNPFSFTTTIRYNLPGPSWVTLKVYGIAGNLIKILVDNMQFETQQEVLFEAKDLSGVNLGSGSYLYELSVRPTSISDGSDSKPFSLRNIMVIVK